MPEGQWLTNQSLTLFIIAVSLFSIVLFIIAVLILVIVFKFLEPKPRTSWSWGWLGWTCGAGPGGGGCTAGMMAVRNVFCHLRCRESHKENRSVSLSFRLLI